MVCYSTFYCKGYILARLDTSVYRELGLFFNYVENLKFYDTDFLKLLHKDFLLD